MAGVSRSRSVIVVALAVLALLGGGFVLWRQTAEPDALARIRREGVIRIGYAVEAPYAFVDARGEPTGESVQLARRIAEQLGIARIEWSQTEFGSLIPELQAGRFDVIAAGMFITPERAKVVAFSEPTLRVGPGLLVAAGNPLRLSAYGDLRRRQGIRVAVVQGSVEEAALRRLGLGDEQIVAVPDALTGRAGVENGVVQALALSLPTLREMVRSRGGKGLEVVAVGDSALAGAGAPVGFVGFAFRQTDDALRTAWNSALGGFVGGEQHLALIRPFGLGPADLPAGRTTMQIISDAMQ